MVMEVPGRFAKVERTAGQCKGHTWPVGYFEDRAGHRFLAECSVEDKERAVASGILVVYTRVALEEVLAEPSSLAVVREVRVEPSSLAAAPTSLVAEQELPAAVSSSLEVGHE